jgi:hypothetical protein
MININLLTHDKQKRMSFFWLFLSGIIISIFIFTFPVLSQEKDGWHTNQETTAF